MPKNIVEDIKSNKREPSVFFSELAKATNKNISGLNTPGDVKPSTKRERTIPPPENRPPTRESSAPKRSTMLWVIAGISLVILFFALSLLFAGAKVTLTPKTVPVELNTDFTAEKDAVMPVLPFQLMVVTREEKTSLTPTGHQAESQKAKGTVVLYNTTASAQPLLINTRLAASNGKIYFTDKALSIPAQVIKDGKSTPGSIAVNVTATEAGESYNSPLTDFTIVGFKGTAKYTKFYGRSKTEITGGSEGEVNTVTLEEATSAEADLAQKLHDTLATQAKEQVPEGFVLFDDALFISSDEGSPNTQSKEANVEVAVTGTAQAFIFNEKDLTEAIARALIPTYDGEGLDPADFTEVTFALKNKESIIPATASTITFTLTGPTNVIYSIDPGVIIGDLLGKKKNDFESIMSGYVNIESAKVVLQPFWQRTFPDTPKSIKVTIVKN